MSFRHRNVPYFSQWADPAYARRIVEERADPAADPTWETSGFADAADYLFWSRKICGLACLKSILTHWQLASPTLEELLRGALQSGAYIRHADGRVDGLIYAPFASWLQAAFGLHVQVFPRSPLQNLTQGLCEDAMAIASVSSEIRSPTKPNERRGGHLVLVTGCDAEGVWVHNPSGATGTQLNVYLRTDNFSRFFAGRGMVIRRTQHVGARRHTV